MVAMMTKLMNRFMFSHRSGMWEESIKLDSQKCKYTFTFDMTTFLSVLFNLPLLKQSTIITIFKNIIHITEY
jgi:hypothetical protein